MANYTQQERLILWIDSFTFLDTSKKRKLFDLLSNVKEINATIVNNKQQLLTFLTKSQIEEISKKANNQYFSQVISSLEKLDIVAITFLSKRQIESNIPESEKPFVYYLKGNIRAIEDKKFTIVGSRKSLPISVALAKDFATKLSNSGLTIVCGCADGIEKSVIEKVVELGNSVITVIPCGIDVALSGAKGVLLNRVANKGLIISEKPLGETAKDFYYPLRNRLLAGLSEGVLVVNGNYKSGVKYTIEHAKRYGVKLYAIPYNIGVESGEITNSLIKEGGTLVDTPQDIIKNHGCKKTENKSLNLTEEEQAILEIVKESPTHAEIIAQRLGKQSYEIAPTLSMLEIKGVIGRVGVNVYGATRKTEE